MNNYELVNPVKPQLYRDQFPYESIPRILFERDFVLPHMPENIWITDTTFRDGQQARAPYTPGQISQLYNYLHLLGGPEGIIRQSEFFLYSHRDRKAVELCKEQNHTYPEITGWIRADKNDLPLVKEMEITETGILTSVSDYHIYLKLKKNRKKALEDYLSIISDAIEAGIRPRCHFEDITRADIYGFCIPFAQELKKLMDESGVPIKIRLCDTMGYGISFPGAVLPRSIPKMIQAFTERAGYPSELLEWHGHNDFHKVHANAATAWLYGVSALNASLLGYGERTGNPPLEGAVVEYIGLKGSDHGMDTRIITEIAEYYRKEIKADIPENYPFIGSEFNTTRAGIHADGLLKNEEIYNIFDTAKILNRPLRVMVTDKSGAAGVARWLNDNIPSIQNGERNEISKRDPGVATIHKWVQQQYENGRMTSISSAEMTAQARHFIPSLFVSDFEIIQEEVKKKALSIAGQILGKIDLERFTMDEIEDSLKEVLRQEPSIHLLALTDPEGNQISQVLTQWGEKNSFRNLKNKNLKTRRWFTRVMETGGTYCSEIFKSAFTDDMIITASGPLKRNNEIVAVMDVDFKFNELEKILSTIPDEILSL